MRGALQFCSSCLLLWHLCEDLSLQLFVCCKQVCIALIFELGSLGLRFEHGDDHDLLGNYDCITMSFVLQLRLHCNYGALQVILQCSYLCIIFLRHVL